MARGRNRGKSKVNATGRNEGKDRFARLPHRILISEAYRSLDLTARALLTELVMIENGENNGSLWLSIKDGTDRLGLSDCRPVMRAFEDLQESGLISLTKEAHFSIKAATTSRARCWRLTWLAWGRKIPSHDWTPFTAQPKTAARKRADRGLRAMARYRKALSSHKMPVVDFTMLGVPPPEEWPKPAVNITSVSAKSHGFPPSSVGGNFPAYTAATMGYGGSVWWGSDHLARMAWLQAVLMWVATSGAPSSLAA